jgi:long-chain acyl-CoA synthetase
MSVKAYPIPSPTVVFIQPRHLKALKSTVVAKARKSSLLYSLAWRHKLSNAREGFITKESLWDRLLFDSARANVVGDGAGTIRSIVVGSGKELLYFLVFMK